MVGAEGFAELLKELKERSGLSYGVLAKRLHVSTSTLHRYVNGTAVPVEFAPVERLGRLCKASPEELVELHRRWIVADATRGRRPDAEPIAPVAEAELPPPSSEPEPSAQPRTESESHPGPALEPAPEPEPAPERDSEPASESHPAPLLITRTPSPRPRPKRRQLVVIAAVGAVLALGGTALALQAASDGSSGDSGKVSGGRGPSAGIDAGEDAKRKQSPSAKSSPGKGKESGKTADKGDGEGKPGGSKGRTGKGGSADAGPGAGGGGSAGDGPAASGAAPLTVSTQPHFWDSPCGQPYLVDRDPNRLSPPPNEQDAPGWVSANGAVPAGQQTVKLTVQGTGKDTVVLESLNVRVVGSGAPLARNSYEMGYVGVGCGGDVPKNYFDLNLDASVPRPAAQPGEDSFPFKVSENDPETFFVEADVKSRDVRWYLELEWSSGGRTGTVRIDDTGKPFHTSADVRRPVFGYSLDSKKWIPVRRLPEGGVEEVR
ncbi:helix-turn-helix transcriptional regulator [Streptomyces lasiicapitis]|uniref:helix-turn-helix domain-containing protein n=1 Tax=Streptomyces lasiicapitis TaxID=1923961 RepID=UPI00332B8507